MTLLPAHAMGELPNWLDRRAADTPHAPALIAGHGPDALRWSFADLHAQSFALATILADQGVAPGDRVAVLLANGVPYVALVHALIRLRAVLLPLNLRLAPPEIAWQVEHAGARLLVHDSRNAALTAAVAAQQLNTRSMALDPQDLPTAAELPSSPETTIDLAAIQCIMYTSGTTGRPKGVLLSYGNHWWSALGSALNLGLHPGDRWLACLPFFHIGGLSILLRCAIYGIPVLLPENPAGNTARGFDPLAVDTAIDEEQVSIISVVSTMLARLLETRGDRPYPPTLRCMLLGGGPAPRPLLEACAARGAPVVQSYGLTETTSQVATLAPADALRKLGSAGRPLLPTMLRIQPVEPGTVAAPDVEGEILVRGPTVTSGYLAPDGNLATPLPAVDAGGWLHTGDVGRLDTEGYLYVLDRRSDLIISGGENVYPAEVEAVLLAHPAVAEAAVYGLPDPRWGQNVAAAIVPRPNTALDEADLLAFCRERLAHYKVPVQLRVVSALPRNASGKILRRILREE